MSATRARGTTSQAIRYVSRLKHRENGRTKEIGEKRNEPAEEVAHADGEGGDVHTAGGDFFHTLAELQQEGGKTNGLAPPERGTVLDASAGAAGIAAALPSRVDFDVAEVLGDELARLLVYADWAKHAIDFTLHLAVAAPYDARGGLLLEVAIMVAFGLGSEEAADTHGDGSGDEFCETAEDDELRFAQG